MEVGPHSLMEAGHLVLAFGEKMDNEALSTLEVGIQNNMACRTCFLLSLNDGTCKLFLCTFPFPIVHTLSHFLMPQVDVCTDTHHPLHKWSSSKSSNLLPVMPSLQKGWLVFPAVTQALKNPEETTQVQCDKETGSNSHPHVLTTS